ncbi:MAG: DUF433 domain-containing protein [Haliscomenobacter sp.]|nr:DUF433 domain-containing protein [Haliscomenobacter sp.]
MIKGTRIRVECILELVASGASVKRISLQRTRICWRKQ